MYSNLKIQRKLIQTITLIIVACIPTLGCSALSTEKLSSHGDLEISVAELPLTDVSRDNRNLSIRIWYPAKWKPQKWLHAFYELRDIGIARVGIRSGMAGSFVPVRKDGPYPVVIMSHGTGGGFPEFINVAETLASNGFIVVGMVHAGDTFEDGFSEHTSVHESPRVDRVHDISFVLDHLEGLNTNKQSLLYGAVDTTQVGIIGHSGGGHTALSVACESVRPKDRRIKAVFLVCPSVPSGASVQITITENRAFVEGGLSDAELASISVPILMIGGRDDENTPPSPNIDRVFQQTHKSPYVASVIVDRANHFHFFNIRQIGDAMKHVGICEWLWPDVLVSTYAETFAGDVDPYDMQELEALLSVRFFQVWLKDPHDHKSGLRAETLKQEYPSSTIRVRCKG